MGRNIFSVFLLTVYVPIEVFSISPSVTKQAIDILLVLLFNFGIGLFSKMQLLPPVFFAFA